MKIDKSKLDESYRPSISSKKFANLKTPVLPNVILTSVTGYYDGPLCGRCTVDGEGPFFFSDVIYDIWRFYDTMTPFEYEGKTLYAQDADRLWRIYGVYPLEAEKVEISEVANQFNPFGIFWYYDKGEKVE